MRPGQSDGNTPLLTPDLERASPEGTSESPRRLLAHDGLHVGASRPPPSTREDHETQAREPALLALVSSARHELRSPLQSIQGFADLLAAETYGTLGNDQRVFVEHIIHGSIDLSRALDACFELVQAELLHLPTEPRRASLLRMIDEALAIAKHKSECRFETQLEALDEDLSVEVDICDFGKALSAIITALSPLARGPMLVSAVTRDGEIEITFSAVPGEARPWRSLHDLPRRGFSARALLWLRLASSLLARASAELKTSEAYDRVRVLIPRLRDA